MEMSQSQLLPVSQQTAWQALNDPEVLRQCIPGCESIERTGDNEFAVAMVAAIGPVKARFQGTLKIEDPDPPRAYKLAFNGQGGAAGFGKGTAEVTLTPARADGSDLTDGANEAKWADGADETNEANGTNEADRAGGSSEAGAEVNLTRLDYAAHAQVGGKIAQIGSRLIDGAARKLAGAFFTAFDALLRERYPDESSRASDAAPSP